MFAVDVQYMLPRKSVGLQRKRRRGEGAFVRATRRIVAIALLLCLAALCLDPDPRAGANAEKERRMDLPTPGGGEASNAASKAQPEPERRPDPPPQPPPEWPPPPEPLDSIVFCAEKCKHIPEMCTRNLHRDRLSLPAPTCRAYSTTHEADVYYHDLMKNDGRGINAIRDAKTRALVAWAGARARERRTPGAVPGSGTPCEEVPTEYPAPMMYPEEFEFVTKLMANARPETYLEWGTGTSTSFYPLMASGTAIAIDGYPPWCTTVGGEPRVRCMIGEGRLRFHCPELRGADGITNIKLQAVGKLPADTSDADVEAAMGTYVDSLDIAMVEANVTRFDVALVDGRFRLQCALKLLPYLGDDSVLLIHDFWLRWKAYGGVFEFYYVIGYARNVVALRKRGDLPAGVEEREVYKAYMKRERLNWLDVNVA